MIITMKGVSVGVLHPDGVIESQTPELQSLNKYWQEEGIFTYGGPGSHETEDGAIAEGATFLKPCAENIDSVIGELLDRGYEVVGARREERPFNMASTER